MKPGKAIEPGDTCVIIFGEGPYRENVGAMLTAVEFKTGVCECGCGRVATGWTFKDASRPLIGVVQLDPFGWFTQTIYARSSEEHARLSPTRRVAAYPPEHLLPIRDPDQDVDEEVEKGIDAPVTFNCRSSLEPVL